MTIDTKQFISLYREAFGENAPLPIVFYYSNEAAATPVKTGGCMFKQIVKAKEGENIAKTLPSTARPSPAAEGGIMPALRPCRSMFTPSYLKRNATKPLPRTSPTACDSSTFA